ncbi:hypothetical protein V8E36_004673 [Tilletia maclaganii]
MANSSNASAAAAPPKVASEDIISQKTDLCISNTIVKTGLGFSAGVLASVILFRRRAFPVWIGTGFGLGSGYTDCERSFNPVSVPGVRIIPAVDSSSSSLSSSDLPAPSSFERLQQRAGEALGVAREKADQQLSKSGGLIEKLETQGKQGLDAVRGGAASAVGTLREGTANAAGKVKEGAATVEQKAREPVESDPAAAKDCLTCRLTGATALAVTGTGAFIEARRLGAFGPVPQHPRPTLRPSATASSSPFSLFGIGAEPIQRSGKAWPRALVGIGTLCYAAALGRLFY